jgi:hypothetical protein
VLKERSSSLRAKQSCFSIFPGEVIEEEFKEKEFKEEEEEEEEIKSRICL